MYQKRSAWILTAVAPNRGPGTSLRDIELAVQTEIPLVKQHLSDQLWALRGGGAHAQRFNRLTGERVPIRLRPSAATSIAHGYATIARFFPGARDELAAIDEAIVRGALGPHGSGKAHCFEDQYASTGGQLYELMAGHDRFIADLRPLLRPVLAGRGLPPALTCHPYDICCALIAEESGVIVTDPCGRPLDAPLNVEAEVAWAGYANARIRAQIEPLLQQELRARGWIDDTTAAGLAAFIDTLRERRLFERGASMSVSRAPGRLDVMGGIADYSGSLVLQRPIAEATWAAVQRLDRPVLEIVSLGRASVHDRLWRRWRRTARPSSYDEARRMFADSPYRWAAYIVGVVARPRARARPAADVGREDRDRVAGARGKGCELVGRRGNGHACAAAACAFGIPLEPRDLALLCQTAENLVAGAPCGVMDQMTCVFGDAQALLALLCQPAELQPAVPVPDDIELWGLDSGERHAVGGSDYGAVRAGAFMGLRILAEHTSVPGDYLANIAPEEFEQELVRHLPERDVGRRVPRPIRRHRGHRHRSRARTTIPRACADGTPGVRALARRGVSPAAARDSATMPAAGSLAS